MESLQTATINSARFLGMENDLGTIEKGRIASLVLLDADPLPIFTTPRKISKVFLAGREFDQPRVGSDVEECGSRSEVGHDQLTIPLSAALLMLTLIGV
jgi:cytosine/adenosine deaminase-related metal-dependent hydrolase